MQQLSLYAPGIIGLVFAAVAYLSVRHLAANRPHIHTASEEEPNLPFEEPDLSSFTPQVGPVRSSGLYERENAITNSL